MKTKISIWWIIIIAVIAFATLKQCEREPRVIIETETKTIIKTDTITKTIIQEKTKTVYIEKVKTIKGKDSIIYKDKSSITTIKANQFEAQLKANNALADLKITTTGELLDVQGVITYPEKETITTITKIKDKSGFYIYGSLPINSKAISPELGVLFQIRNKVFISSGIQYNNFNNNVEVKIGLGVRL